MAELPAPPCPAAVRGCRKLHCTQGGRRRRRNGEGDSAVCLSQQGAPHPATGHKSADKAGPNPGQGQRPRPTGLARMLLSSLTGCLPFPQASNMLPSKKHAFSHPTPMSPEWQRTSAHGLPTRSVLSCPASSQAGL